MKDLVVVGAGGFGRETALMIDQLHSWKLVGFYDDGLPKGTRIDGRQVKGNTVDLNNTGNQVAVVIAIADPIVRQRVAGALTNEKLYFPSLFHPGALKGHESNAIGRGCIITAGVIMTTGIAMHDFVIVNLSTTIGHDVTIGEYTSIMPQCSISGNVKIGKRCFIGSGARILQGVTIGDNSIIGAGAVVTKSFGDNSKLMGIPAINK